MKLTPAASMRTTACPGDGDPNVLAGDRPGPGVGEDVLPGSLDLLAAVQAVPARMNAAGGVVLQPNGPHRRQVPRLQGSIKSEIRSGYGCRIGGHAHTIYRRMTDDTGIGGPSERFPATRHSAVLA